MKILKQGKSKEEIYRITKEVIRFECPLCDCVFEADNTEYKYHFGQGAGLWECDCSNCGMLTTKSIPTRQNLHFI